MESYTIESNKKKSRIPARLDLAQSGTGLVLGLFMWVHMLLVGSIVLGTGSFNFVAKTMELSFLSDTGHGYPLAVFFAVLTIFTLFIVHALLGVRKFPISWKQHRIMRDQMQMMNHTDTNLWYIQVVTGFLMFFLGSVHLYIMLTNPGSIDPYLSADRVVSGNMWFLYLVLLICVELHGTIGIYRLCMKWGWFAGKDPRAARTKLKLLKNRLTIFFLALGVLALLVFVVIGINHRDRVGERYGSHKASVETIQANEVAPDVEIVHPSSEAPAEEAPATEAPAAEASGVETGSSPEKAPVVTEAPPAEDDHGKEEAPTGTAHDTMQPAEKH
ncbi:MAG: fumarate reductase cytochrome b subunit [Proteobacteria bacterium]|nr:fumarate reductase cytochrome b subunit [Desulfobacula sp.]MBU3954613.1 fumarate reductase cytochrome b subunit [Pseudomonadota bacterium]MBU4131730.1 fumarate reductase cytochrome b subunit [Pseudomonadota bacterium]